MTRAPHFAHAIFLRLQPGVGEIEADIRDGSRAGKGLYAVLLAVGRAIGGGRDIVGRRIVGEDLVGQLSVEICRADRRPVVRAATLLGSGFTPLRFFVVMVDRKSVVKG